jgi:hypothetical protein
MTTYITGFGTNQHININLHGYILGGKCKLIAQNQALERVNRGKFRLMSAGPFAAVIALTHRIQWFDKGEATNIAQHHHAWVVFDHAHPTGRPPILLFV